MFLRSPVVRKVGALAILCLVLISLFHYYEYKSTLNYKPSKEFLNRVAAAKRADAESSKKELPPPPGRGDLAMPGHVDPQIAGQVDPQIFDLEDPQIPGQVDPQIPGQVDPQIPGQVDPQIPGQVDPQIPGQVDLNKPAVSAQAGSKFQENSVDNQWSANKVEVKPSQRQPVESHENEQSLGEQRADPPQETHPVDIKVLHSLDSKTSKNEEVKTGDEKCVRGRNRAREQEWMERDKTSSLKTSRESRERADKVKEMMNHAWSNYRKYAWGSNEVAPQVKRPHGGPFPGTTMGLTIADSLDTLWIMGMFDEVERGKQWLVQNLTSRMNVNVDVSVFEFNIRYVGGMLSMYALTNECDYKQLAMVCADKLLPAFNTSSGIPLPSVNLKHGRLADGSNMAGGTAVLSEIGTLHLEFVYLSHITGKPIYRKVVEKLRQKVVNNNLNGLYSNTLHIYDGKFDKYNMVVSLGGMGDSFYEYLFKSFLQSGGKDLQAKKQYFDAMQAIYDAGILKISNSGLQYFGIMNGMGGKTIYDRMEHLACFIGGLMALSAKYSSNSTWTLNTAMEIGKTCHESYQRSDSRLGPESFTFFGNTEATATREGDPSYHLRPEVVETWYFLQRVTRKSMYQQWAWDMVQALERHCREETGYVGLVDVYLRKLDSHNHPLKEDVQQSFFLAETLKYLYLIFKDSSLLPLDEWVFNTEAHPLPVLHSSPTT